MGGGVEIHRGKVRVSFRYRGRRYRESLKLKATPANLNHGRRLAAEIAERIRAGTFHYAAYFPDSRHAGEHAKPDPSFAEVAARYLATLEVERSTRRSYQAALDSCWLPALGAKPIRGLRRSDVLAAIQAHRFRSAKTRNNYLVTCRGVFAFAIADELLDKDPTASIRNVKVQAPEPDPLTLAEVEAVLGRLRERYPPQVAHYFEFAFFTGLRPSEQIALAWADVDLRAGTVRVERARVAGEEKARTKTHRRRLVELNSRALGALQRQRPHSQLADGAVFLNPATGRAWANESQQRRRYWQPTLRALGLRQRDAYQTRHTFATLNLMAGANVMWVARQLGHVNALMLMHRYARWIPDADQGRELAKVEAALGATMGTSRGPRGG